MYNMQLNTGYAGKPHVTAENCADLNRGIVGSDSYVLPVGAQFEVELVTNNLLKIKDGCGCMQGRQVSIAKGQTDEITIENGTQGEKRIDLVVIRYSKNADTGIETAIPFLVKGIPSENNPVRPEHLEGDIRGGDLTADWPLYELYLDGISVTNVKPLFDVLMSVDSLNRKLPFCGRGKGTVTSNEANSLNIPVTFPTAMNNTDYVVCANLVTGSIGAFDKNYDVEVIVTKKSLTGCTLSIMRGTFGFLDYGAVLSVEYIVLPS